MGIDFPSILPGVKTTRLSFIEDLIPVKIPSVKAAAGKGILPLGKPDPGRGSGVGFLRLDRSRSGEARLVWLAVLGIRWRSHFIGCGRTPSGPLFLFNREEEVCRCVFLRLGQRCWRRLGLLRNRASHEPNGKSERAHLHGIQVVQFLFALDWSIVYERAQVTFESTHEDPVVADQQGTMSLADHGAMGAQMAAWPAPDHKRRASHGYNSPVPLLGRYQRQHQVHGGISFHKVDLTES
jgi:hypothetical protein